MKLMFMRLHQVILNLNGNGSTELPLTYLTVLPTSMVLIVVCKTGRRNKGTLPQIVASDDRAPIVGHDMTFAIRKMAKLVERTHELQRQKIMDMLMSDCASR
jgi:hypothetical protein